MLVDGKLMHDMIKRQELEIVNNSTQCTGWLIKRRRIVDGRMEESCIDSILVLPDIATNLNEAIIDSDQI